MSRYDWLKKEAQEIGTKRFHVIEALAEFELQNVLGDDILPAEYKDFVRELGRAKLYRQGGYYKVGVIAPPEEAKLTTGEDLLRIGHFDDARAYFKSTDLTAGGVVPVFEWGAGGLRSAAGGFEDWLKKRCVAARKKYGARWKDIVRGPQPFSAWEIDIVEARRHFHWKVLGVTPDGDLRFEVENLSELTLPYLSIGVRSLDGKFEGGVWLPVSQIAPRTRAVLERDCYKKLVDPANVQLFALPDPEPEDRERYWEFRNL